MGKDGAPSSKRAKVQKKQAKAAAAKEDKQQHQQQQQGRIEDAAAVEADAGVPLQQDATFKGLVRLGQKQRQHEEWGRERRRHGRGKMRRNNGERQRARGGGHEHNSGSGAQRDGRTETGKPRGQHEARYRGDAARCDQPLRQTHATR